LSGEKKRLKIVYTPGFYDPKQGLFFEQVKGSQYIIWDFQKNSFYFAPNVKVETGENEVTQYTPLKEEKVPWLLCDFQALPSKTPTLDKLKGTDPEQLTEEQKQQIKRELAEALKPPQVDREKLWDEVRRFIYEHVELPDDRLYDVLTAWVFATYTLEFWDTVPYIFFYGPVASGKTRGLTALAYLSYRGKLSVSSTPAALFRTIEKFTPTVFLDEAEVYKSEDKTEIIACLNAGYKRDGGVVERYQGDEQSGDVVTFRVFGFKAVAGTAKLKSTLESRSIIIRMNRNLREVRVKVDREWANRIRCQLLVYRFLSLASCSERSEESEDKKGVEGVCKELEPVKNSRVYELFEPLVKVSNNGKNNIIDYALSLYRDQIDEEQASVEAQVVNAIIESADMVEKGKIGLKTIAETFNRDLPENEKWHTRTVGSVVRRLGFKTCRVSGGRIGFYWNPTLIERLKKRYLEAETLTPTSPPSSLSSLSSQNPSEVHEQPSETASSLSSLSSLENGRATCWICLKTLDMQVDKWTYDNGKPVHLECYKKTRMGARETTMER